MEKLKSMLFRSRLKLYNKGIRIYADKKPIITQKKHYLKGHLDRIDESLELLEWLIEEPKINDKDLMKNKDKLPKWAKANIEYDIEEMKKDRRKILRELDKIKKDLLYTKDGVKKE